MKINFLLGLLINFLIACNSDTSISFNESVKESKGTRLYFVISKKQESMSGRNKSLYRFDKNLNKDTIMILRANTLGGFIDGDTSSIVPNNIIYMYDVASIGDTVIKYPGKLEYELHTPDTVLFFYVFGQKGLIY